jgi:hypothetical protein
MCSGQAMALKQCISTAVHLFLFSILDFSSFHGLLNCMGCWLPV